MNQSYAILKNYNQVMAYRTNRVLQCPYEETEWSEPSVKEDIFPKIILQGFMTGMEIEPPVPTTAIATFHLFIDMESKIMTVFIKGINIDSEDALSCELHTIQDNELQEKIMEFPISDEKGFIVHSIITLDTDKIYDLLKQISKKNAAVLLKTKKYPMGEIGGYIEIIFQWK